MKTRAKTLGLHEWSENDTILTLYFTKYGTKGLYLKTDKDISNFIGVSIGSLKMQSSNIRALMGQKTNVLSDYSTIQEKIFNKYNEFSQIQLMRIVQEIIGQIDYERKQLLIKMGKDPSKMKLVRTK
jgi:hypothetical protein